MSDLGPQSGPKQTSQFYEYTPWRATMANRAAIGMAAEKFMAAIAIDEIIVARTGLVTSRPTRGRSYCPKGQYRARRSGVRIAPTKVVCGRFAINRRTGLGDGVMIIIAWLIVVLMTPVDAAAHAPSLLRTSLLLATSADRARTMRPIGHSGFSPRDFGRTPDGT